MQRRASFLHIELSLSALVEIDLTCLTYHKSHANELGKIDPIPSMPHGLEYQRWLEINFNECLVGEKLKCKSHCYVPTRDI